MKKHSRKTLPLLLVAILVSASLGFAACGFGTRIQYSFPNLIAVEERDPKPLRPINDAQVPTLGFSIEKDDPDSLRMQLAELLYIVSVKRSRPVFTVDVWAEVRDTYSQAVNVLNRYIKNAWHDGTHDFEKVLAIHDYLASEIRYDYALYERSKTENIQEDETHAFEMTGVFLDKKAVCDGLSKAFVLLCAIEGIEARYVLGTYADAAGISLHAWNKVMIDGVWYNVDVTLDNVAFSVEGKALQVLGHGYFLRSDRMMYQGGHVEDDTLTDVPLNALYPPVPASGADDYGFFEGRVVAGLTDSRMTVYSDAELKEVFKEAKLSKNPRVGAVQLKLDFTGGGEPSNAIADYADAIADAYREAGVAAFSYTPGMQNPPFIQYPGGIFLFLLFA